MKKLIPVLMLLAAPTLPAVEREPVAILLHERTERALAEPLRTYLADVEQHFPVKLQVVTGEWTTPEQVRNAIKELHRDNAIAGVVLVGAMPMHRFYMHEFANPNPLYYEDFDLEFNDRNEDGVAESYEGEPSLKVWVANLRSSVQEDDDDIAGLKKFFAKTHTYYETRDDDAPRALAVSGSDWSEGGTWFKDQVGDKLFPRESIDVLEDKACTLKAIEKAFKEHSYTLSHIQVHSDWNAQSTEDGDLTAADIASLRTGSLITINHGCSTGNWMQNKAEKTGPNMAMSFVFGKSIGQAVIAQVRSGMIDGHEVLYDRLQTGDFLGKAYLEAKRAGELQASVGDHLPGDIVCGVLLIGNPFLKIQTLIGGDPQ